MRAPVLLAAATCACGDGNAAEADARPRCEPGEHDEDGDGVVDDCDNCPTIANADQTNSTELAAMAFEDDVGDACDRRPGLSGDRISAFYPFATDDESRAWSGSGWMIVEDGVRGSNASWKARVTTTTSDLIVVAKIEQLQAEDVATFTLRLDGALSCELTIQGSGDTVRLAETNGNEAVIGLAHADKQSLVAWRRTRGPTNELVCAVERGAQVESMTIPLTDDVTTGSYEMSVYAGFGATVSSVVVYTSPSPKTP